jgi:hypothetical protein
MNKYAPGSLYKIEWPILTESIVENAGTIAELFLNTLMTGGIDKEKRDGMDAKQRAQDFEMGTPGKQLGENKYPRSQDVANVNDTCKLWRELAGDNIAKVRRLVGLAEGGDTMFHFAHQLKKRWMKIEYKGKPYNCTKCGDVIDMTNTSEIKNI